jgi:DNA-binding beta-propeller fold protein YncE/mono/diheme cytochrome c family protein
MGKRVESGIVWVLVVWCALVVETAAMEPSAKLQRSAGYRGPVDLVLADDETWLVTANELANSLSLIDLKTRQVVDEVLCSGRPAGCAKLPGEELLVSCREAGVVRRMAVRRTADNGLSLQEIATIDVGFEPLGLAVDTRRMRAYVGLVASAQVAEIDLNSNALVRRLDVGNWPRYLAVSPDGSKLAVGLSGQSSVAVFDLPSGEPAYEEPLSGGINLGMMRCSKDGQYVYFPWMIYRSNPIDPGNIRRGWVLASRVARVRLDGPSTREAISLDVPRLAVADPHGLAITPNESHMAVTSAGTQELLVYRLADVPFIGAGGPGDLIDPRLQHDKDAFFRIPLGGRPLGIEPSRDNRLLFVVNHTLDVLQIVDLGQRAPIASIALGSVPADLSQQLVHRGLEIFHDAGRSMDQWYSCRSCHLDGGSNAKAMDTWNDGTALTPKTVLPLTAVTETAPWTWHGWQEDLDESIQNSFVSTMQGKLATDEDVAAVRAYMATLRAVPNPFLAAAQAAGSPTAPLVEAGKQLFHSSEVGCAECHAGSLFTDGQNHDVGLGNASDKYQGFNTPSLAGVYAKVRLLHDGRSKSLEDVLTKWHTPSEIGGGAELTSEQLKQLVAYLKTL